MSKMRPFKSLISFQKAFKIVVDAIKPISRLEEVSIEDSCGRILAEDMVARISVPPFDRAAMDGYAVIAEDTFGADRFNPKELIKIDVLHAGQDPGDLEVKTGKNVQIATGAVLPRGADAVVMVEDTEIKTNQDQDEMIQIFKPVYPGENVSKEGTDMKAGETVLKMGIHLNPSQMGVLASIGIGPKVKVFEKPKISIIATGTEIAGLDQGKLHRGQVFNSNSYSLAGIVVQNGGIPLLSKIVADEHQALDEALTQSLENDLVVLSGGSSVGERDILVDIVDDLGEILFHGVQIKPGKPILCALTQGKMVLGMPGYPTSCTIAGYSFLAPAVRKLARLPPRIVKKVKARLGQKITSSLGRHHFFTVRLQKSQQDGMVALPAFKESGAITSMAHADGFIEIPENVDLLEKGDEVEVTLL